ncbi:hypothetical protein [Streptomyces sp. JW3]|uniref:hypothetical protein n=1 Tax=Streptomyces sp. JW3 TaxID=3456955 RepID=UPI003FA47B93
MVRVKLMAEYECYPVWVGRLASMDNVPAATLPISRGLIADIGRWAEEYEATYDPDDPLSSGFSDDRAESTFVEKGTALATRLQRELGSDYAVAYYNMLTSADEPAPPHPEEKQ